MNTKFAKVKSKHIISILINALVVVILLATPFAVAADYVSTAINRIFIDPASMPIVADGYQVGDEIGFIMETTPKITNGAVAGAGAWATAYIPAGVEVVGAELVTANSDGTYSARPAKDIASIQDGCGPRGCSLPTTGVYQNGALAQNQQDTGIFYSADARTALLGAALSISPTGPLVTPQSVWNQWDYDQVVAFGTSAALSGNGGRGVTPVIQIGGTWYGTGSPVAGADTYFTHDYNPACDAGAVFQADLGCVGPWQRIQYDNSKIAASGAVAPAAPTTGTYVNNGVITTAGTVVSPASPLPSNTNAVRFVQGARRVGDLEYSRITLRITDLAAFSADIASGTKFCMDSTGGDHDRPGRGPQDNIWRYYEGDNHVCFQGNTDATLLKQAKYVNGAPSNGGSLQPGDVIGYEITFYNTGATTINNIVISDNAVSNLTLVAAGTPGCAYSSYNGNQSGQPTFSGIGGGGTTATWNPLASLAAGQSVTVYVCGQVPTTSLLGDQVKNNGLASYSGYAGVLSSSTLGTVAPKISGTVYNDADSSTNYTAGDSGISGVTVQLYQDNNSNGVWDAGDTLLSTTVTSASGYYEFNGMPDGNYVIKETDPAAYYSTGDTQGALTDNQIAVTIASGTFSSGNDFFDHLAPGISKSFSPATIDSGATSILTITLTNPNGYDLTSAAFTDTLPAGVTSTATAVATTCGGTASKTANTVSLSGGTIPANGSCTVTAEVTSTSVGAHVNTIPAGGLTTSGGSNTTAATDTLTVTPPPSLAKSFSPDPILAGGVSVLTFTVTNPSPTTALTNISFTDALPSTPGQMVVANPPGATSDCGTPTFNPAAGDSSLAFSGGSLAANSSCTVSVNVVAPTAGTYNNTSGALSTTEFGTGNTASASLTANASVALACGANIAVWDFDNLTIGNNTTPTASYAATTASAALGGGLANAQIEAAGNPTNNWRATGFSTVTTLITTNNDYFEFSVDTTAYSNLIFTYDATRNNNGPQRMTVYYSTNGTTFTASGTVDTIPTAYQTFTLDLSSIPALNNNANAKFRIYGYRANATNGIGRLDNVTLCSALQPPSMTKAFSPATIPAGGTSTLTFTLTNPNSSTTLNGVAFSDAYPSGLVNAATPAVSNTCGGTASASAGGNAISLVNGSLAGGASCQVTVNVTSNNGGTYNNTSGAVSSTNGGIGNAPSDTLTVQPMNFGHLPANYLGMNLLADGGAYHLTDTLSDTTPGAATYLGASVTTAADGINTAAYTPKNSDDGVTWTPGVAWTAGGTGSLNVSAVCTSAPCYFYGWLDWNQDGDFYDTGETLVLSSNAINNGLNTLTFNIPAGANLNGSTFYSRFRIYSAPPTSPAPNGAALNGTTLLAGEIEDPLFQIINGGVPTPVTVAYVHAERRNNSIVDFTWATDTETGNAGFNLYVKSESGEMAQINRELIPSAVIDSLSRQDYSFSANTSADSFYIEDVGLQGETRMHGPFIVGESYGEPTSPSEEADYAAVAEEHRQKEEERQAQIVKDLKLPAAAFQTPANGRASVFGASANFKLEQTLNFEIHQDGLYRVTYETLRAAGLELQGMPASNITLTRNGRSVPIFVQGKRSQRLSSQFGPGGYIEFYATALDTLYTDASVYTLRFKTPAQAAIKPVSAAPNIKAKPEPSFTESVKVNRQATYSAAAPGNDPWYDTRMMVFTTPKTWNFPFQVNGLADSASQTLSLTVWGMTNWNGVNPDHHMLVSINGTPVADERFEGAVEKTINVTLPAGTLREGENSLEITMPGDAGVNYEIVNMDKFAVQYRRSFAAQDGRLAFTASGKVFKVTNLPSQDIVVYRISSNGTAARLTKFKTQRSGNTFSVTFSGTSAQNFYIVSTSAALYAPSIRPTRAAANLLKTADYLIIAHPDFIDGLQPLIAARQAQGLTVSVVDVNDIYAQYSYGVVDALSIKKYIAYAQKNLGVEYVLLVGGDTYDYRNYTGNNSVSFIPSLYVSTGNPYAKYVPTDALYTDTNNDNIPDLAIGRFPARTSAELDLLVNKTLAYDAKDYGRTAIFASDTLDGLVSFKDVNDGFIASLPSGWTSGSIALDNLDMATAKTQLAAAMNAGAALVTYTGHSSATNWSKGLFSATDAAGLTNNGRPFVAVQWGCWNTYYVDPFNPNLTQSLLFSGNNGAAATLGAVTITDSSSERELGLRFIPRATTAGKTVGTALLEAKQDLAQTHPEMLDVLLGWSLMGDPALVIEP